jgi:hypothetical protein
MKHQKYLDDISEIKQLMNRSSRFLSLSGLSGILIGIYALGGAFLTHYLLNVIRNKGLTIDEHEVFDLVLLAIAVLFASILTALFLSYRKAKQKGYKIWDAGSKNFLISLLIPLVTGGIFGLVLIHWKFYVLIAPITMIFYGLALINASKYTYDSIFYLGLSEVILGLLSAFYPGYGLFFWAAGFGVLHIIYGFVMYYKYDKTA